MTRPLAGTPAGDQGAFSPQAVNKFGTGLEAAFFGAGRRRSPHKGAKAAATAEADRVTAEVLAGQGLDPWSSDEPVTRVDLATMGQRTTAPALELRRWCVFGSVATRDAGEAAAEMASFLESQEPEWSATHDLVCMVLRRHGGANVAPTGELAARHHALTKVLGPMLTYAGTRHAGACTPLSYGVHHRMLGRGERVDLHSHLTVAVERTPAGEQAKAWLVEYLKRKFTVHDSPHGGTPADDVAAGAAAAAYEEDGFSAAEDGTEAERARWLAEYVRQTHVEHHLHRRMTLGPLREHVGALRAAKVRPVLHRDLAGAVSAHTQPSTVSPESTNPSPADPLDVGPYRTSAGPDERPMLLTHRPVRTRPPRWPLAPALVPGPRVLAVGLSWLGGNQLRPVLLVKGWDAADNTASWQRLNGLYDLDPFVAMACAALVPPAVPTAATAAVAEGCGGTCTPPGDTVRPIVDRAGSPAAADAGGTPRITPIPAMTDTRDSPAWRRPGHGEMAGTGPGRPMKFRTTPDAIDFTAMSISVPQDAVAS